jgi:pyruvate-formate lyase-activating enzyme
MRRVIKEAYALPSIRVVFFTGGEPTLYPELLQAGINYLGAACRGKLQALAVRKEEIFARWEGKQVGLPA